MAPLAPRRGQPASSAAAFVPGGGGPDYLDVVTKNGPTGVLEALSVN
jgi:hypothetical protein